jgi:phosphate:Na+ symporter
MASEILPLLLGGLVLFLYAIAQLSEVMKTLFSEKAKKFIEKFTSSVVSAILIGTVLTVLLGSSSAVIIIVIVFINAQTLTFKQAVGLIMGANIGTTFSSQIIALNIGEYSYLLLFIGLALRLFVKNKTWKNTGSALLYFGVLFFGLFLIEMSVEPLQGSDTFLNWLQKIEGNAVSGALIGGLVTLIIQSSSGTVGMAIVLAKQQLLSLKGSVSVMLGAELGTCSDTLIATINGTRQALKAGLFHLFFNLITILIGLAVFHPFVNLVEIISAQAGIGRKVANAHMLFNTAGVLLFLPFVGLTVKLLNKLLPERNQPPVQHN